MISQKIVKNNVVYNVLKGAWANLGTVKMKDLEDGVMTFDFENNKDMDWVRDLSPWAVHCHCLNLQACEVTLCVTDIDFSKLHIWVQVHNLSSKMLNAENAGQIANLMGKCTEIENDADMQNQGYIRMRIEVDVRRLLQAGFYWSNGRGEEKWVVIKYERLSNLCYGCGMLGHTSQGCTAEISISEVNSKMAMYGPWMNGVRREE